MTTLHPRPMADRPGSARIGTCRARALQRFAALLLWAALSANAHARVYNGGEDLSAAWRDYLAKDADREPGVVYPYSECFRRAAIINQLPETLLLAVARGESDFNPDARSHANAHGLMQILWPSTARHLGLNLLSDLYQPCKNVDAGARYLKELLARYEDDLHLALAAYNYGPTRIRADDELPGGAEWYSGYIYRHLQYVLGTRSGTADSSRRPRNYVDEGKIELISFSEPYRASAFVAALERDPGGVRIDWFRSGQARFKVVLLYEDGADFERSRSRLERAGFKLPD